MRRNSASRALMTGPPSSARVQIAWRYSSSPAVRDGSVPAAISRLMVRSLEETYLTGRNMLGMPNTTASVGRRYARQLPVGET